LHVKYAYAATYGDWREEKKIRRTCHRLLGVPHKIVLLCESQNAFLY
jgi:hypothetical protein